MWTRDRSKEPLADDMKEEWRCPKCGVVTRSLKYCIAQCIGYGVKGPNGKVYVSGRYAIDPKEFGTKYEHLHSTCLTCGYETLEKCLDATSVEPSGPVGAIEP